MFPNVSVAACKESKNFTCQTGLYGYGDAHGSATHAHSPASPRETGAGSYQ